jgi:hypothetical protein
MRVEKFNGIRRIGDPRDILVTSWELENETIQVFKPMYRALHDYLKENGWEHPLSGDDVIEDLYWERWGPSGLKEQWAWWRCAQDKNQYVRWLVLLEWQTLFVKADQAITYKGKKAPGKVERINLKCMATFYLQFDINDLFKNSIAWKFKKAFFNRMYIQEMEQHRSDLYERAHKIEALVKRLMVLESDWDHPVLQYGPFGYADWGDDTVRNT